MTTGAMTVKTIRRPRLRERVPCSVLLVSLMWFLKVKLSDMSAEAAF